MKFLKLLILVLLLIAAGAFGALNADPVAVDLFGYSFSPPLGALILGCLFLGVLLGALALLPFLLRRRARPERATP